MRSFLTKVAIGVASLATCTAGLSAGTKGGGNPEKVKAGELRLLIEGGGLKSAMVSYMQTIETHKIEDEVVKSVFDAFGKAGLVEDIQNSLYVIATATQPCVDAYDHAVPASTTVGVLGSSVCFDIEKLVPAYLGLNDEDTMIKLASLAFHEHTHHIQKDDKKLEAQNEFVANRVAGYISITAKFVQLPLLKWTQPVSGPAQYQEIQTLYNTIRAKERAFIAPSPKDYALYPDFQNKKDRGVIRLLPREKYDDKLSIRGGASYYSFVRLTHEYGYGTDIGLEQGMLRVGFAGCDFGHFAELPIMNLNNVSEQSPGVQSLMQLQPAKSEPEIRKQQRAAWAFNRVPVVVGKTYALRSINFDNGDIIVAIKIIRIDQDGSVILAWKKIKNFPVPSCR